MSVHGLGTIQWGTDNLPVATPPEKKDSPSSSTRPLQQLPSWGLGYVIPFPIHSVILAASTLHGSFTGDHKRQHFVDVLPVLWL